jgi:hypothetical protein
MSNVIEVAVGVGSRPGEYSVRVVRAASGGEPHGVLHLDVEGLLRRRSGIENAVLASAAQARSGVVPAVEQPLRSTGQEMFEALFTGAVGETYRASLAVARERGTKLRVVLHLEAPELSALPWEAMWDPELKAYLCRKEPLVRHVPAPYTPEPLPVTPPLRILGLVASPRGLPALDVEREQQHLDEALSTAQTDGRVVLEWLPNASWDALQDRLLTGTWHVLHFIGHGDYDASLDQGRVALVDGTDGRADWVEAGRLVDLLNEADPTPRLVVLNSCSSGQAGTQDVLSGTAAALVNGGISAVAAMQFRISDPAAVAFPRGFYKALSVGKSVDAAMSSGRIAILGRGESLEWVTPVLYVRGDSAQLFSLATTSATSGHDSPRPPAPVATGPVRAAAVTQEPAGQEALAADPRYVEAEHAYRSGHFDTAIHLFEQVASAHPGVDLPLLEQARKRQDLASWWAQPAPEHARPGRGAGVPATDLPAAGRVHRPEAVPPSPPSPPPERPPVHPPQSHPRPTPPPPVTRGRGGVGRRTWAIALGALGLVAVLGLVAAWLLGQPEDQIGAEPRQEAVVTAPPDETESDAWEQATASWDTYRDSVADPTWSEPLRGPGGNSAVALSFDGEVLTEHRFLDGGWREVDTDPIGPNDLSVDYVDTTEGGQDDMFVTRTDPGGTRWGALVINDGQWVTFRDGANEVRWVRDLQWDGALRTPQHIIHWLGPYSGLLWPTFPGTSVPGDSGETVLAWQDILIRAGFISDSEANRDGYYGPLLQEVVRAAEVEGGWENPDGEAVLGRAFYDAVTEEAIAANR